MGHFANRSFGGIVYDSMSPAVLNLLCLIALLAGLMLGMLLVVFQLPGTWFILVATTVYAWHYHFQGIGWITLVVLGVLAIVAEAAEVWAGFLGASKAGASKSATWGAFIGGLVGLIAFTPLIPIPIVGSILGGVLGCFGGAFVSEYYIHTHPSGLVDAGHGLRVGFGAAIGRLAGLLIKMLIALIMTGTILGFLLLHAR